MVIYLKNRIHNTEGVMLVDLCITSIIVTSLAFIFSTAPVDIYSARYLLDITVFISIVFGSLLISEKSLNLFKFSVLASVLISIDFAVSVIKIKPVQNNNVHQVIGFIKNNHLDYGFAGYWNAAPFTLLSDNNIKVRQVLTRKNGTIVPYLWLSDSGWYINKHPQFVILGKSSNSCLTDSVLIKNFGDPKLTRTIGMYKVIIFNK
jgi:hypothetical protein